MAEMHSTCLVNKLLDTGSLKSIFAPGATAEIRFYENATGPTGADMEAVGTVIAIVKEAGGGLTWAASAADGVLTKGATAWTDPSATGGTAKYYRLVTAVDDDSEDTGKIYPRIQGPCGSGLVDGGMNMSSTTIAAGLFTINYYSQSLIK